MMRKQLVGLGTVIMFLGCMASLGGANNSMAIGGMALGFVMLLVGAIQNVRYGQKQREKNEKD